MTEADSYYYILRIRDELFAQSEKLDKIAKQLEAQTKLQEGILKQLYLLCQMTSRCSIEGKNEIARESEEVFMNTPIPEEKSPEVNCDSLVKRYTNETGAVVYFSESNDKFIKWILRNITNIAKEESEHEN